CRFRTAWSYVGASTLPSQRIIKSTEVLCLPARSNALQRWHGSRFPFMAKKLRRQGGKFAANDFFPGTQLVRNSLLHPHISLPDSLSELRDSLCRLGAIYLIPIGVGDLQPTV